MNPGSTLEAFEAARAHEPKIATPVYEKEIALGNEKGIHPADSPHDGSSTAHDSSYPDAPTEEELNTLHRVSGSLPWQSYTIAFVELCERFSYYGTTVLFTNFIQRDLPTGSRTGAGFDGRSGALGLGQRASTGLTTFNQFWAYMTPLFGAYIADEYLGRFKTIQWAILVALIGHIILIVSATPPVIVHPNNAVACFAIGLIIMGIGVGMFKSNISPLIAEQYRETKMRVITTKKGERKILDPTLTVSRIFLYFYMMINIGSIVGQVSMVYAENYVGFWLAFSLPTFLFILCPLVLFYCRNRYILSPPNGSVLGNAVKLWKLALKGRWSANPAQFKRNLNDPLFWEKVKPSHLGPNKPQWMTFDDEWVDQVRRGLKACTVFLWMPLYWVTYNQMNNNLISQAGTMDLKGIPSDLLNNLNPLTIIIFIPVVDFLIYPGLRKAGIKFTPIKRITTGFFLGSLAMMVSAVTQHYIYATHPCGSHRANECANQDDAQFSPIIVWVQTPAYVLIGFSEIFANITSLEYAFTKAPKNMRSLVMSVNLFMSALGSALNEALVGLAEDPLLVWNYGSVSVVAFVGAILFWISHHALDKQEDALNMLPDAAYIGRGRRQIPDAEIGEHERKASVVAPEESPASQPAATTTTTAAPVAH